MCCSGVFAFFVCNCQRQIAIFWQRQIDTCYFFLLLCCMFVIFFCQIVVLLYCWFEPNFCYTMRPKLERNTNVYRKMSTIFKTHIDEICIRTINNDDDDGLSFFYCCLCAIDNDCGWADNPNENLIEFIFQLQMNWAR